MWAGDGDLDLESECQGQMFLTSTQVFLNHKVLISKRGVAMGGLLQVTMQWKPENKWECASKTQSVLQHIFHFLKIMVKHIDFSKAAPFLHKNLQISPYTSW